jgi:hypothetical protein
MKTQWGSRGSTLSLTSALDREVGGGGGMGSAMPKLLYPQERDWVLTVREVGWAPGPVWTGVENLTLHRTHNHF